MPADTPGAVATEPDPLTASPSLTTSIGGPAYGRLEGAIALPPIGRGFRSNERRPNVEAYFGTVETIRSLIAAAAIVDEQLPGSALVVNDIGFRDGGPIPHHGSHQAGRDVDVLFYYLDRTRSPFPSKGIPVDPRGRGWDFGDLATPSDDVRVDLDVPRTWKFVEALLASDLRGDGGLVQRIFVAEHVRTMLLEQAERVRAPRAVRARFADITCQPSYPHDDHLHIRFFCSSEDLRNGCADGSPIYPWRRQQLRAEGLAPVMAPPRPRQPRDQEGPDVANPSATPEVQMHRRVRAFLDERATWWEQPHPDRPYCR